MSAKNSNAAGKDSTAPAGKGKKGKNPKVVEVIDSEKEEDEEEGDDGDDEDDEDEDGEGDDEGEHLPKAILKRIGGLMQLHGKSKADIDAEYRAERAVLEAKFDARRAAVYEQRRQIISGLVEPVLESEDDAPAAEEEATSAEEAEIKGIPQFWLTCMANHPLFSDLIQESDIPALEALEDITVDYNPEYTSFTLKFHFAENEFFSNSVLEKSYTMDPYVLDERPDLADYTHTEVEWKAGKKLIVKEIKKKQKAKSGKNKGQIRVITREVPIPSFFHFFTEPKAEDEEEEEEEEEKESERTKLTEEEDYEVAFVLRSLIVPNAIMWYTGQAQDENYMGYDEDDDEDDDEDGEDGGVDDDDDDDDDDEDAPKLTKSKAGFAAKSKGGAAAAPNAENPECKQN